MKHTLSEVVNLPISQDSKMPFERLRYSGETAKTSKDGEKGEIAFSKGERDEIYGECDDDSE